MSWKRKKTSHRLSGQDNIEWLDADGEPVQFASEGGQQLPPPRRRSIGSATSAMSMSEAAAAADPEQETSFQERCVGIASHSVFIVAISVLILANVVLIALEEDHDVELPLVLKIIFQLAFLGDFVLRAAAAYAGLRDTMLLIDAVCIFAQVVDLWPAADLHSEYLRSFQMLRLVRLVTLWTCSDDHLLLRLLAGRLNRASSAFCQCLAFVGLLIIFSSVFLTVLAGIVADDGEEVRLAVLHAYGSIMRSVVSVVQAMAGTPDWSADVSSALLRSANEGNFASGYMLVVFLMIHVFLTVIISALVTGVVVEHLSRSPESREDAASDTQQAFATIREAFAEMGYSGDDLTPWEDVNTVLTSCHLVQDGAEDEVEVDMSVAHNTFTMLARNDGCVCLDNFLFALFRQRSTNLGFLEKIIEDYWQELAQHSVQQLYMSIHSSMVSVQSRLTSLTELIPRLHEGLQKVQGGIDDLKQLEGDLRARQGPRPPGAEPREPRQTLEEAQASSELNAMLCSIEEVVARLRGPAVLDPGTMDVLVRGIVDDVHTALQEDFAAVRAAAAGAHHEAHCTL